MKVLLCVDIDDTILRADTKGIGIWKVFPDGNRIHLSTDEFAEDPDRNDPEIRWDYSEFRDPKRVRKSILRGTPMLKNLKVIDEYLNEGADLCFLTARGTEDVIKDALPKWLKMNVDGELKSLGDRFKLELSTACNDEKYCKIFDGYDDPDKKAWVLEQLCKNSKYDRVIFFDDDRRNCAAAESLGLEKLLVIRVDKN